MTGDQKEGRETGEAQDLRKDKDYITPLALKVVTGTDLESI